MLPQDLPEERLASTAQDGSRVYIHPAEAKGKLRSKRGIVYDILLVIFLFLPWVRIHGQPILLLDIPRRHFNIFGLTFWGHDAPMLFLVFVLFVVTIGLITAIFGRGWCGWACPQTVFIDRFFMRIERWIDGSWQAQHALDKAPMSPKKFFKRIFKWTLFTLASLVITHSFLAYFVGTEKLAQMVMRSPAENPTSFLVILITTAVILFDFGWFREQFCIIACPYGRLQSVLMDEHSLVVAYDPKRGEPRGRRDAASAAKMGDCVNCYRCVQVCPTGIDIRRGVQLECIACTSCIDACNDVMTKTGRQPGLIRYDTEANMEGKPVKQIRVRTVIYAIVITAAASALTWVVSTRELIKVSFVHAIENPYQLVHEGQEVINHYKVNIRNQNTYDAAVDFEVPEEMKLKKVSLVMPVNPLTIGAGKSVRADLFVTFPRDFLSPGMSLPVIIKTGKFPDTNDAPKKKRIPLVGPGNDALP